jgi:GDPmannose 4,6-dehydratase
MGSVQVFLVHRVPPLLPSYPNRSRSHIRLVDESRGLNRLMKKALITGITGQDGSYLAEFLISKGYEVHGLIRKASTFNTSRIDHLVGHEPRLTLHYGDILESGSLTHLLHQVQPEEVYHLAAQSHVRVSFDLPLMTGEVTGLGTLRLLETMRSVGSSARFYQASSSEMFGNAPEPQGVLTPLEPRSPYAAAKVFSYWTTRVYREAYGMHATNGILFNHESPRRGITFVTRKITRSIAEILAGKRSSMELGNIDSKRDWGFAPEYVEAMWHMVQKEAGGDYVVGTGESRSVREFLHEAFSYVGRDWRDSVSFSERLERPLEVDCLRANVDETHDHTGWKPKVGFRDLVRIMVDQDLVWEGIDPPGEGVQRLEELGMTWTDHRVSSVLF